MRLDVWPFMIGYLTLFHILYHVDIYSIDYAKIANEIEDPSVKLKLAPSASLCYFRRKYRSSWCHNEYGRQVLSRL